MIGFLNLHGTFRDPARNVSEQSRACQGVSSFSNMPPPGYQCVHGKYKYNCYLCKPECFCPHKQKPANCWKCPCPTCIHGARRNCRACATCHHGEARARCRHCIREARVKAPKCEHGKKKSRCAECGYTDLCHHGKERNRCRACDGKSYCPHNKLRYKCVPCSPRDACMCGKTVLRRSPYHPRCRACHTEHYAVLDNIEKFFIESFE